MMEMMDRICKNCANSEKICGATMIVICGLTQFPKNYDHNAKDCIGFEPKEEENDEGIKNDTTW